MLTVIGAGLAQADIPAVTVFANQASVAIENARLHAQQRQQVTQMALLGRTALDIVSHLDMSPLLRSIIERAARLLDATGGVIHLYDLLEEELEIVASQGLAVDYAGTKLGLGEGVAGKVVQRGDPVIVNDYVAVRRLLGVTACSVWLRDEPTGGLVCRQATGSFGGTVRRWRLAPGAGIAGWVARTWLTHSLSEDAAAQLLDMIRSLTLHADQRPETVLELAGIDPELKAAPIRQSLDRVRARRGRGGQHLHCVAAG